MADLELLQELEVDKGGRDCPREVVVREVELSERSEAAGDPVRERPAQPPAVKVELT